MARVGSKAPDFDCEALVGQDFKQVKLSDYAGKYVVLFFYPLDFTFVCPTEILAFNDKAEEFEKANCALIGASVDSVFTHRAWINTARKDGGLGGELNFPLLADLTKSVAKDYDVLMDEGITLRGLFVISDKGIVRSIIKNDPPVGRSVDEVLRLVRAYQYTDEHGEVCPANWTPGSDTMIPDPVKSKAYFEKVNQ